MSVSIILPHYKTEQLVKLCLRSIRKHTASPDYEVIVVDNNSGDDPSLKYLRQVKWIKLIERTEIEEDCADAHKAAVDIGIANSSYPYILAFHTDSIPIHDEWLNWLIAQINTSEKTAAVGTYKLEMKAPWQLWFKKLEHSLGLGKEAHEGTKDNPLYIRSHCALYRREILQKLNLRYVCDDTAGRNIHFGLLEAGYDALLLPVHEMLCYVAHLNHGTKVLNPELGARQKTIRRGKNRIEAFFASTKIQKVYQDLSLDN